MATIAGKIVLFAGLDGTQSELDDTWAFDGTNWSKINAAAPPPPVAAGSMASVH